MRKLIAYILTLVAVASLALAGGGCSAGVKATYHLKRAERFFDAGQFDRAEIEYENVLRNRPQNANAWARLGMIFFDEGRGPESLPVLLKARQMDPANLDVRLKLGILYLELGQSKQACDEAGFVLSRNPGENQALLLLARATDTNHLDAINRRLENLQQKGNRASIETAMGILALRRNDSKTAQGHFIRAISIDPGASDAYTALATLPFAQKDLKQTDHDLQVAADLAPPWSGNTVRYAQFKILTGDAPGAESLLRQFLAKSPFYLPAWMTLAQLSASQNNYSNALTLIGNLLNRDPRNFNGLLFRGQIELIQGQRAQAVQNYQQMARIYPRAPSVFYALAQACLANDQTNEAEGSLDRALKLKPDFADAILLRAETEIVHGNPALAIVALKQLVERQPRLVQAWLLLADAYRAEGVPNRAVQIYQELEKSYPERAEIPVLLGAQFFRQHQNTAARAQLQRALRLAPDYLPAVEQSVNLDLLEKRYTAALQQVQQLTIRDPNRAALQLLLGTTLAAGGETNQAELALSKAIKLQPDSPAGYLLLAQLYSQTGQHQQALRELQLALEKDPNDVAAIMLKGIIYNSQANYKDARDAYQKVLAIVPDDGIALNNLACIYADHLNRLDQAYPLARRARDVAPSDPSVADTLGWILYRRGEYTPALVLLRQSAGKLDSVPEIEFHLGMACYMAGFDADAKTAFDRALHLKGDFPENDDCRRRLAILHIDPDWAGADTRTWLEKWNTNHPGDPVALARLSLIYQFEGLTNKAIATDEAILNANTNSVFALANLARLYAPTAPQKARSFAKSAYDLAPEDPEISHLYGCLVFKTGDYPWALTLLQLSVQALPQNPDALFDLGEAFYSMGKVSEAKATMQKALQSGAIFTRSGDAKQFLEMAALANNVRQESAAQIVQILNVTPDYVPALMVKAAICKEKSDTGAACQIYQQILKIYPNFSPAKMELAILYANNPADDAKEYSVALQAYQAYPDDPKVAKSLGMIVCRQGDYTRAAHLLEESAHQLNDDPRLLYYLGLAQFHLDDVPASKANLQRALSLDLSGQDAADARRMLAELK